MTQISAAVDDYGAGSEFLLLVHSSDCQPGCQEKYNERSFFLEIDYFAWYHAGNQITGSAKSLP